MKEYIEFLSSCKTERECIRYFENLIKKELQGHYNDGELVFYNVNDKALVVYPTFYSESSFNILCAHVDSPRLDLKQKPVRVDKNICYFDTHYYGGIKKYQWVTIPLAIHGVVYSIDGGMNNVVIGEEDNDPVFCISDLLPHLAKKQYEKSVRDFIDGESLDVIIENINDDDKKEVKNRIYSLIEEKYGIFRDDFVSAELEVVPAGKARELGINRSMILGYGQDDRSCAYASCRAFIDAIKEKGITGFGERIPVLMLVDKEEIGSIGGSGMNSLLLENAISQCWSMAGMNYCDIRKMLTRSYMLSNDVTAAFDPKYKEVFDEESCAYLGKGPAFCKFTGAGGKYDANDANPEYIAKLRKLLQDTNIQYQMTEMSKVDVGGGGTIAQYAAKYGMNVIDVGVPVLNMHAPHEITSKEDIQNTCKLYKEFLLKFGL